MAQAGSLCGEHYTPSSLESLMPPDQRGPLETVWTTSAGRRRKEQATRISTYLKTSVCCPPACAGALGRDTTAPDMTIEEMTSCPSSKYEDEQTFPFTEVPENSQLLANVSSQAALSCALKESTGATNAVKVGQAMNAAHQL
mmetsp:Transcript_100895/g.314538  ORF Transcript_100895/g.314538 Transcript_100895/m.314538 type:complete len:142 (+) Transcript_100895:362-787(+)